MTDPVPPPGGSGEPGAQYRISIEEFRRRTPRVYGGPANPDDPDGEVEPATAFAMIEQPEPPPSPNTIEGLISGIGRISASAARGDARTRRMSRALLWVFLAPLVLAGVVALIVRVTGH